MREITSHKVNGCNEAITIHVIDEPGAGGASHRYEVGGYNCDSNPSVGKDEGIALGTLILFQNGPVREAGTNGLTHESLLAVVIDRLQCFQKGPHSCRENAIALTKLEEAMLWLQKRTRDRVARGIEGRHEK